MNKVRVFNILCQVSIACIVLSALFRIQHWPLGHELSLIGTIVLAISSVLYFAYKPEKSFLDRIALVAVPAWCLYSLSKKFSISFGPEINFTFFAFVLVYIVYVLIKMNGEDKANNSSSINWERILFALGMGTIIVGVILKYNHLPYSRYFFIAGIGISLVSYMFGFFVKEEESEEDDSPSLD